ncbi:MAG: hypothetical protein ACP5KV_02465, partial [Candidatus Methanomethylicaceae archaeon]
VHSQVVQNVATRVYTAFKNYFDKRARFPKHNKESKYRSFTYPQSGVNAPTDDEPIPSPKRQARLTRWEPKRAMKETNEHPRSKDLPASAVESVKKKSSGGSV